MAREIQDITLQAGAALPNAANTVNGNVIDLGATTPWPVTETVMVRIKTTTANGSNSKNINIRLQHSAESNANFTNISELANPVLRVTDNANAGFPASSIDVYLPPSAKQYLRGVALGEANGGDAGNGTFSVQLRF